MPQYGTGTIYTSVVDTWDTLIASTGITKEAIISLNPHVAELAEIEAGIPIDIPYNIRSRHISGMVALRKTKKTPYQVARDELLKHISEFPGKKSNNPRITLYHSTTAGGAAPDETSWCSSFVNFCVEQAGLSGTDSKAARSWLQWGVNVPKADWQEGDIVVFWREAPTSWKGHVGFLVDASGPRPEVLGGNQGNRISISTPYPYSQILSVRRSK